MGWARYSRKPKFVSPFSGIVRFFTSNLKKKAVWDSGAVYIPKQTRHGIDSPKSPEMFNGMEEIGVKIKAALRKQSIDIVRYNSEKTERKIS